MERGLCFLLGEELARQRFAGNCATVGSPGGKKGSPIARV